MDPPSKRGCRNRSAERRRYRKDCTEQHSEEESLEETGEEEETVSQLPGGKSETGQTVTVQRRTGADLGCEHNTPDIDSALNLRTCPFLKNLQKDLIASGAPDFSVKGWKAVATRRKSLQREVYNYTYTPPKDWAIEHNLPPDKKPLTRIQIKELLQLVPTYKERKRIRMAAQSSSTGDKIQESLEAVQNDGATSKMRSEQQMVPASAAPIGRAKLQRAAKQTAAERIRKHAQGGGPVVIANNVHLAQQTAGQCVSDAQQPSREMQDLRTLLSEYRDKVAALEDAALEHSAAKDELEAKLRDVQEKQQALVAKAIQKAQKEGQRGSEKLQKQLQEQAARADVLELALEEAQASSAAVGTLSDDTLLVHALDLMKKSPAHRQRLLDIGQLLCKE